MIPKKDNDTHIKVCLCAIGKKENLYVNEYLNHYKKIGYSHIFLYDNNEIGDESNNKLSYMVNDFKLKTEKEENEENNKNENGDENNSKEKEEETNEKKEEENKEENSEHNENELKKPNMM